MIYAQTRRVDWTGWRMDYLCAAAERLLQQAGELRVAVGDVSVVVHERRDDSAQGEQTLVDAARLARTVVLRAGTPNALRPDGDDY